jgi:hypothetical protein
MPHLVRSDKLAWLLEDIGEDSDFGVFSDYTPKHLAKVLGTLPPQTATNIIIHWIATVDSDQLNNVEEILAHMEDHSPVAAKKINDTTMTKF